MPVFARSFDIRPLAGWMPNKSGDAVRLLFGSWVLPGEKATREAPLRLGLRDGYVNFYVEGQSVAKLSCGREGPKLSVHKAYVAGQARGSERDGALQSYEDYNAKALTDPATATVVAGWINGELRASEDNAPKVLGQIDRYVRWMSENGRVAQVQEAYRNTAATLIEFYHLFRGQEGDVPECVQLWKTLAATEAPAIIVQPGIVIGNYWPEGSTEGIASGRMAQSAAARNKHREKIERHGIHVHEVGPDHKGAVLPPLSTATVLA